MPASSQEEEQTVSKWAHFLGGNSKATSRTRRLARYCTTASHAATRLGQHRYPEHLRSTPYSKKYGMERPPTAFGLVRRTRSGLALKTFQRRIYPACHVLRKAEWGDIGMVRLAAAPSVDTRTQGYKAPARHI